MSGYNKIPYENNRNITSIVFDKDVLLTKRNNKYIESNIPH